MSEGSGDYSEGLTFQQMGMISGNQLVRLLVTYQATYRSEFGIQA